MPTPMNPRLYAKAKAKADETYKTHSAYKSGFIVKEYKRLGGKYLEDSKPKDLKRWFKEKWGDVGNKKYPVYRPSVKVSKKTPLLASEIDPKDLKKKISQKQKIKSSKNLKPFKAKK
jgi:hypothetical protein